MTIDVLRPSAMPPAMLARWRELHRAAPGPATPFLGPDWALAVERALGEQGGEIRVAVISEAGTPRGFLPARVGAGAAMGTGAPMCDYQGLVAESGLTVDPRALTRALGVGRLDFCHVPAEQAAFAPFVHGRCASWLVDVSEGYGPYQAARRAAGGHLFRDFAKKRRKAQREVGAVTFDVLSRAEADFERLFAWKGAQLRATGQVAIFATPWPMRLMRDLYALEDPAFRGGLFALRIGGELAAAQFHLIGDGTLHAWVIAHDPRFDRYSPGLLLFQQILEWMPTAGLTHMDLGPGDYRFKRQLANLERPLIFGFVGTPSPAALVRGAAYGIRRAAETLPLGPISALPGKAMRRLDVLRALR